VACIGCPAMCTSGCRLAGTVRWTGWVARRYGTAAVHTPTPSHNLRWPCR